MAALTMTIDTYRDKILGAWQGKSAGATLGAARRGQMIPGRNNFYHPVPGQPVSSLTLDFPLIWLHVAEESGPNLTTEDLAVAWLEHLDYSEDEFGYAALNLRRGLPPPASGAHSNWFRHGTGGLMRADFWAMLLPGAPQVAASYAYHDAKLDHSEEGIWAAMFLAAVGSAAFFLTDPIILLTIGLAMIPRTCRTARAVKTVIAAWQRAAAWLEARENVLNSVSHKNYTDVPQNIGFFTIGLLYGQRDFGTSLCAATNCGYDSEVIGAAMGTLLGIMKGSSQLPEPWIAPIGDLFLPGVGIRDYDAPFSLGEIVARTVVAGQNFIAARCPDLALTTGLPGTTPSPPLSNSAVSSSTAPETPNRFSDLDLLAMPESAPTAHEPVAAFTPLPNSPLAADTQPPSDLEVAPGEALPYRQPAQTQEQPLATDPNLIASGLSSSVTKEEIGTFATGSPAGSISFGAGAEEETGMTLEEEHTAPQGASPLDTSPPSIVRPQSVSAVPAPPAGLTSDPFADPLVQTSIQNSIQGLTPAPDPVDAIAWADSTQVKPLLITPTNAMIGQAGPMAVLMDTGDSPTIAYNVPKTLSFVATNQGSEPFTGRITLLAPPGWQIAGPPNLGQRQFIAANAGTFRADFSVRAPDGAAHVDIANAVTLRFTPENGAPPYEAEFLLLGASCWWTVGPFANFDGEGFDRVYAPEERPGLNESYVSRSTQYSRWDKRTFTDSIMNLDSLFQGSSGVVYGQTILRSPAPREARLVANTNSGVKIWLSGALVLRRFHREPFRPLLGSGNWSADVLLRAGDNPLFVKWVRGSEPFEFSLTVSDRFGRGLPEVGNTTW